MKLFLGEYGHSLDERSRVTLPRKLRQELDDREVILSRGFEPCIFGFDRISWEREATKHLENSVTDERARQLRRYMFAAAERIEIDKLGRILVPALLKEYADISVGVTIIGAGDHFEIWDEQRWKEYSAQLKTI